MPKNKQGPSVQGCQPAGETLSEYPLTIAGTTSAGAKRTVRTDDNGKITVIAEQSDGSALNVQGAVAHGASIAAVNPILISGRDGSGTNARIGALIPSTDTGWTTTNHVTLLSSSIPHVRNGTALERQVSALAASGTIGTGLLGAGMLAYDNTGRLFHTLRTEGGGANQQNLRVGIYQTNSQAAVATPADSQANAGALYVAGKNQCYNGATWDMERGNTDTTIYTSAARTATPTIVTQTNYNARGVVVFINVTAVTATPSVTPSIRVVDPITGTATKTVWTATAAITAASQVAYLFYPGVTASAAVTYNEEVDMALPRSWQLVMTHANGDSITYTATASYIL